MATPFKHAIRRETLAPVADRLAAARPGFPTGAFLDAACAPLDALELKARVSHVADTLREHLDPDWPTALAHLVGALPPPLPDTHGFDVHFAWWPVLSVVERHGRAHPAASLPALRVMTRRFSAEFAVRPFLMDDPAGTLAILADWVADPCPHVRRLVSEGTRPRLPWGPRLPTFAADPTPVLPLLDRLVADPSLYVRRSVANHLGDIAKDHPALAVEMAGRWLAAHPTDETRWVVRHGLRHPVKQGEPAALALLGFTPPRLRQAEMAVTPAVLVLGGALEVSVELLPDRDQRLALDLVLGLRRADGSAGRKVFKWTVVEGLAGTPWSGTKRLPLRRVTTRRHYPGRQTITLQVNGEAICEEAFHLEIPSDG